MCAKAGENTKQIPLPFSLSPPGSVIFYGDALKVMSDLPTGCIQTAVTSPPYWGLRDYGTPDQLGSEDNLDEYILKLVIIFRELRRVLADEGTFWLNIGVCYTSGGRNRGAPDKNMITQS